MVTKVLTVTSGKGGVGKSTTSANVAAVLAKMGFKTVIIDFDVGLRKIDGLLGLERRVIFDFVQVMRGQAKLKQALIQDKELKNLYLLPTSNSEDKSVLTDENVADLINELKKEEYQFDFIICDSPAGIESGAEHAMHHADEAIVVVNPEYQSITDADRMIGLLDSKTKKIESGQKVEKHLLITKYNYKLTNEKISLTADQIQELLSVQVKGIIPSCEENIIDSSNKGRPIVLMNPKHKVSLAYENFVKRILNKHTISVQDEEKENSSSGFLKRLFGG